MRTGTIIATDLSGINNEIFHVNDTVNEEQFGIVQWDKLVADGFIKPDDAAPEPTDEEVIAADRHLPNESKTSDPESVPDPLANVFNKEKRKRTNE